MMADKIGGLDEILNNSEIATNVLKHYERIFEILREYPDFLYSLSEEYQTQEFYDLYFERFPQKFDWIPNKFKTQKMCDRAVELNSDNIKYVPSELKTQEMCVKAVELNLRNIQYIPDEFKTMEMCVKAVVNNHYDISYVPNKFKTQQFYNLIFDLAPHTCVVVPDEFKTMGMWVYYIKLNWEYRKYVPDKFKTQEYYDLLFDKLPQRFYWIPDKFKTQKMCDRAVELNSDNIRYVPSELKTQEMCVKAVELKSLNIQYIPDEFKTQEMCDEVVVSRPWLIKYIPDKFKTQKMCDKAIEEDPNYLEYVPAIYQNEKMCDRAVEKNLYNIKYVADRYKKKYLIDALKRDVYEYSRIIPNNIWDEDIVGQVVIGLRKLAEDGKKIPNDSKLCLYVIRLYPELDCVLDKEKVDYIRDDLYALLENGSTVENIALKHNVHVSFVNMILEDIKSFDMEGYNAIKRVLATNQNNYFFDIMNDVSKLGEIIMSLGNIEPKGLSSEQKIKFAYLYCQHIHHSLEEIYNFNYKKYGEKNEKIINSFFVRVLKYKYLKDDYLMLPERLTILHNNSWLKKYDRNKFFSIKNGVPTAENRYGANQTLLTMETEEKIISILRENEIPLNDFIVRNAFKEFFNGKLDEFIVKLKSYDEVVVKNKSKK